MCTFTYRGIYNKKMHLISRIASDTGSKKSQMYLYSTFNKGCHLKISLKKNWLASIGLSCSQFLFRKEIITYISIIAIFLNYILLE